MFKTPGMVARIPAGHIWRRLALLAALALLLLPGCARKSRPAPGPTRPVVSAPHVPFMGYCVQVGAFARHENASRLKDSLLGTYPDVYFFRHSSGLYKVRFGNFSSRSQAERFAEQARRAGIIDEYYIVRPEDYAVARTRHLPSSEFRLALVETGYSFLGLPYQWGGESAEDGFDCSGLTMTVYQLNGLQIPRSSGEQYAAGSPVSGTDLQQGDLVFFRTTRSGRVSHVGLYLGNGEFLHAPGRGKTIRTDSLSNGYFAARYMGARTYLR